MSKNKKLNKKGFTLIELLAVLMIIGVLASFGIPRYFRAVERNRLGEAPTILAAYRDAALRSCLRGSLAAVANMDVETGALRYFNAPTISGDCSNFVLTMARTTTELYTNCGNNITASLDVNGTLTWNGVIAGCQP